MLLRKWDVIAQFTKKKKKKSPFGPWVNKTLQYVLKFLSLTDLSENKYSGLNGFWVVRNGEV